MGNLVHCWVLNTCKLLVWVNICRDLAVVGNSVEAGNQCRMFSLNSVDTDLDKIDFKHLLKDLAFSSQKIDPINVSKRLVNFRFHTWNFSASRTFRSQDKVSSFTLRIRVSWWFPLLLVPVLRI
jgi:hypothetical protein